jgi:hypothetical protein
MLKKKLGLFHTFELDAEQESVENRNKSLVRHPYPVFSRPAIHIGRRRALVRSERFCVPVIIRWSQWHVYVGDPRLNFCQQMSTKR